MTNHPFGRPVEEVQPWEEEKESEEVEVQQTMQPEYPDNDVEQVEEELTYEVEMCSPDRLWGLGSVKVKAFVQGKKKLVEFIDDTIYLWDYMTDEYKEKLQQNPHKSNYSGSNSYSSGNSNVSSNAKSTFEKMFAERGVTPEQLGINWNTVTKTELQAGFDTLKTMPKTDGIGGKTRTYGQPTQGQGHPFINKAQGSHGPSPSNPDRTASSKQRSTINKLVKAVKGKGLTPPVDFVQEAEIEDGLTMGDADTLIKQMLPMAGWS